MERQISQKSPQMAGALLNICRSIVAVVLVPKHFLWLKHHRIIGFRTALSSLRFLGMAGSNVMFNGTRFFVYQRDLRVPQKPLLGIVSAPPFKGPETQNPLGGSV